MFAKRFDERGRKTLNKYPEHEKLTKIQDESNSIGGFLEWLQNERQIFLSSYVIGEDRWNDEKLVPTRFSTTEILADFFEIDLNKLEDEKRQMLEEIKNSGSVENVEVQRS